MHEQLRNNGPHLTNDVDSAIELMREAGQWLIDSGRTPSKWWDPKNLNREFLLQYAQPEEFRTLVIDGVPAAAVILQPDQNAQDWAGIDGDDSVEAFYVHWLCVSRDFAGQNIPKIVIDLAAEEAKARGIDLLRADTNAEEQKLRGVYESIGFELVAVEQEDYRATAFYQKDVSME
jgi:ribosomal protein S18 acetylase RimI-like enzyme